MRKQIATAALVAATAAGFAGLSAVSPAAPPANAASCTTGTKALPDFDGSGGNRPDVAIGIPGEDLGEYNYQDAGLVEIRYAGDTRTPQALSGPDYSDGDRFGTSFVARDVNGDSCSDLLVGMPGDDRPGLQDAGAVEVYLGSPTGLRWSKTLAMGQGGIPGPAQPGAQFGSVLTAFPEPDAPFLAGLPLFDVNGKQDAGAVLEFTLDGGQPLHTQDSPDIDGVAEAGDHFGAALASESSGADYGTSFEVGAPLEDVGSVQDAGSTFSCSRPVGAVTSCEGLSQDSPNVPGVAEAGDHFGAAIASGLYEYIGVPGEDIGSAVDAGMILAANLEGVTQNTEGVPGAPESGDQFGASIVVYRPFQYEQYVEFVHVGVPGEDLGTAKDAGQVANLWIVTDGFTVIGKGGLSADPTAGTVDAGDRYGATLGSYHVLTPDAGDEQRWSELLVIGSPGSRSGAGEVITAETGNYGDKLTGSEAWQQITGGQESGDGYGGWLNAIRYGFSL
jgi:hypothetical protein